MPYINNNDKPSFLNRKIPTTPQKGLDKPSAPPNEKKDFSKPLVKTQKQDESLFGGKSQITGFNRSLEKNPEIRKKLAEKLGKKLYSLEVNNAIKEIEEKMKNVNRDGIITKKEVESMYDVRHYGLKGYLEKKHEMEDMTKGGITQKEKWEFTRKEKIRAFLKNLFGLDKK